MVIQSFVRSSLGLQPIQVEVVLVPGVSQIQVVGLADQLIRESTKKILSALRYQGFRLPVGRQAIVNLYPNHVKKTSQGLDMAIALGLLLESGQIEARGFDYKKGFVYGALTLKGEVVVPQDLELLNYELTPHLVLSGPSDRSWRFPVLQMEALGKWDELAYKEACPNLFLCGPRPHPPEIDFDEHLARLMAVVAIGEHSLLLAGASGLGKTTFVDHLSHVLRSPREEEFLESKKYWRLSGRELLARPFIQPHHTTTSLAMIGGGNPPRFGEISLAHGGTLVLDELLEFHPLVQSALREPMEKGEIYISRSGGRCIFPARALILATTNLCPCGGFHPQNPHQCRCSSLRLRHYLERLTGPFLDRFCIFHLMKERKKTGGPTLSLSQIRRQVDEAHDFIDSRGQKRVNQRLTDRELLGHLSDQVKGAMIPHTQSYRRRLSLLRVARSLADLEKKEKMDQNHLEEAQQWTSRDMYLLQNFPT